MPATLPRTVTISPGANGLEGTKAAPSPWEKACRAPVWAPVLEPLTLIDRSAPGGAPSRLMAVAGEAA